jgi:probable HAF family extracellular repeat protein
MEDSRAQASGVMRGLRRILVVFALSALVVASVAAGSIAKSSVRGGAAWVVRDLGWRGSAVDVNESGLVVGDGLPRGSGSPREWAGYLWDGGRILDLGVPSLAAGRVSGVFLKAAPARQPLPPSAINASGQVIGVVEAVVAGGSVNRGFLWEKGRMIYLGTLSGFTDTWPSAINDRGQVVGKAYRWDRGTKREVSRAFVWEAGTLRSLGTLGGDSSEAIALNDRGQVVGVSSTRSGRMHAFLWQSGRMIDLGVLPGMSWSKAVAINERGQVIGNSYPDPKTTVSPHAFLWRSGRLVDLAAARGTSEARAINDRG